jgi:hypothetical protein
MRSTGERGGVNLVCPKCFSEDVRVVRVVDGSLFAGSGESGEARTREEIHCRNCRRVTRIQKGESAV